MKALVFGGAFNPPTKAHVDLALSAMEQTGFEKVIFVPSKMRYITEAQQKDYAFDDHARLAMLRRIAEGKTWMEVSDYELTCAEQPRTYRTLCHLREEGYECRLLFGSDKLTELQTGWKHVEEIAAEFGVVCMERYEDDCRRIIDEDPYLSKLRDRITVIATPAEYHAVSSTAVRAEYMRMCGSFRKLQEMVPAELEGLKEWLQPMEDL